MKAEIAEAEAAGTTGGGAHAMSVRVYYEDTDAAGIVYYANHLKFAERARTEMLRRLGLTHPRLQRDHGIAFVVRHCVVDYIAAARLDDELTVHTHIAETRCASVIMDQTICRHRDVVVHLRVKLACVGMNGKAVRMPAVVRAHFAPPTTEDRTFVT